MSNELTEYCELFRLDKVACMNLLQQWNLVSDCAVTTDDVAPSDCDVAIRFCRINSADLKAAPVAS